MSGRGYALTLPRAWQRIGPHDDVDEIAERVMKSSMARESDGDGARSTLRRRYATKVLTSAITRAFAAGCLEVFAFGGASRTGILPMTLSTTVVHTGLALTDEQIETSDLAADGEERAGRTSFTWLVTPAGPVARFLIRRDTTPDEWAREMRGRTRQLGDEIDFPVAIDPRVAPSMSSARITFVSRIPGEPTMLLVLLFDVSGPARLGAHLAHADSIVSTLRWTEPA